MSRLDEECIMAIVRERSGISSGEIDIHINHHKFEAMSLKDFKDARRDLNTLIDLCDGVIFDLETMGDSQ